MNNEQRNLAKEIPFSQNRAELTEEGQAPSPDQIRADKAAISLLKERVLSEVGKIERHILDSPMIGMKQLLHQREQVKDYTAVWNWLHGIEYNRFTLPEQKAAADKEAQEKTESKLVSLD